MCQNVKCILFTQTLHPQTIKLLNKSYLIGSLVNFGLNFSKLQRKNKWALFVPEGAQNLFCCRVINISVLWLRNLGVTLQLDDRIMQKIPDNTFTNRQLRCNNLHKREQEHTTMTFG